MRPKRQSIIRFWRSSIRDETELKKLDKIKEQIEINKIKSDERTEQYKKDCDWLNAKINERKERINNDN